MPFSLDGLRRTLPGFGLPGSHSDLSRSSRFSEHFQSWLKDNGYGKYRFAQGAVPGFGGRSTTGEKLNHEPVIFIHGNTDNAASWAPVVAHFKSEGYADSELYGMSWGSSNRPDAYQQFHSREFVEEVRAFIEAVKQYTGAKKVDVISHSMGVTLARKAIQGGKGTDRGTYDLGKPLTKSVDTFVGIAGANKGLSSCGFSQLPTCNTETGFHPSSEFLRDLNEADRDEGSHIYSLWSNGDFILGLGNAAATARIPGQDGEKGYARYSHFEVRDQTPDVQVAMVRDHAVPSQPVSVLVDRVIDAAAELEAKLA